MARIRIAGSPTTVEAGPSISILNALLREGVRIRHDCGGKALCGTCRVRVISGGTGLSPIRPREAERLAATGLGDSGRRLACQARAAGDVEIEIAP